MKKAFFVLFSLSIVASVSVFAQDPAGSVSQLKLTAPTRDIEAPKPYVFGPGDEISVKVMSEPDYNFAATVDENGNIEVPFLERPMAARCKTDRQLREDIQKVFRTYLVNPQVNIKIEKRARPPVTVFGEVLNVSKVDLTRRATLMEMLAVAGGPTKEAGRVVQVYRPQRMTCTEDEDPLNWKAESGDVAEVPSRMFKLSALNQGLPADNPVIIPGDVIYVPQASPVYIVGEVRQPGSVLLKFDGGMTLFQAVNLVGGPSSVAKTKDVKIYRRKPNGEKDEIAANLDHIRNGKQKDLFLEPYDVVVVDKAKKSIALTIAEFAIGSAKQVISSAANTGGMRVMY